MRGLYTCLYGLALAEALRPVASPVVRRPRALGRAAPLPVSPLRATNSAGKGTEPSGDDDVMTQIRAQGRAGIVSYILWEWAFWGASVPVVIAGFYLTKGTFPDFGNAEDVAALGGAAFALLNVARAIVPLRASLVLATTPWVSANIVEPLGWDQIEVANRVPTFSSRTLTTEEDAARAATKANAERNGLIFLAAVVVVALRVTTAPADVRSAFLCETAPAAIIEAGRCLPAKQWFWEAVIAHFP